MRIINRTPHPITINPTGTASEAPVITLPAAARGEIARVETASRRDGGLVTDDCQTSIPVTATMWGRIVGLPEPVDGVAHVVSVIVAAAAYADGRTIADLYVPGDQVRDASGRVVGCASLTPAKYALPGYMLAWSPKDAMRRMDIIAALLCYSDDMRPVDEEQALASRRRGCFPMQAHYIVRQPKAYGGGYVRVTQEWGTDAWAWEDITAEQARVEYYHPQVG